MDDRIGRMLSNPLRRRLLLEYSRRATSPGELARRLSAPLNLVSYHTRVLSRQGCLELVGTERRRGGVAHVYRAIVPLVIEVAEWEALPAPLRRSLVLDTLAEVTEEAHDAAVAGGFDLAHAHLSRSLLELDDEGIAAVERCLRAVVDELAEIEAASKRRSEAAERRRFEVVMAGFAAALTRR